jgi:hypothetical protein
MAWARFYAVTGSSRTVPPKGDSGPTEQGYGTPTRVFLKKRLQATENKGRECEKKDKETKRGCNRLITGDL